LRFPSYASACLFHLSYLVYGLSLASRSHVNATKIMTFRLDLWFQSKHIHFILTASTSSISFLSPSHALLTGLSARPPSGLYFYFALEPFFLNHKSVLLALLSRLRWSFFAAHGGPGIFHLGSNCNTIMHPLPTIYYSIMSLSQIQRNGESI
jgi:hypothetical protein